MEPKIESLKTNILAKYETRIDDLLSICESPIEQLMILHFLNHFNIRRGFSPFDDNYMDGIDFLSDEIALWDETARPSEIFSRKNLSPEEIVVKYGYHNFGGLNYEKVVGFAAADFVGESTTYTIQPDGTFILKEGLASLARRLNIYPQKEVNLGGSIY